ncbi:unnamed protein product [marine sediment metagenome]|uniref:Uncharacterized protein n=1 Tax=marine sediment metagenome TaxID=412755 RepID=X0Y7W1_9ZZZZ
MSCWCEETTYTCMDCEAKSVWEKEISPEDKKKLLRYQQLTSDSPLGKEEMEEWRVLYEWKEETGYELTHIPSEV